MIRGGTNQSSFYKFSRTESNHDTESMNIATPLFSRKTNVDNRAAWCEKIVSFIFDGCIQIGHGWIHIVDVDTGL